MICFPDRDEHLVNYVVARPDHSQHPAVHAEKILLDRLTDLEGKCALFSTILVYSWLMPCSKCTTALIKELCTHVQVSKVIVYNTELNYGEEDNVNNRKRLRQAGIDVYKIPYKDTLPPIN